MLYYMYFGITLADFNAYPGLAPPLEPTLNPMRIRPYLTLLLFFAWIAPACGPGDDAPPELPELPPAEVFNWGGQPFSVSPPPEGWRREKSQSGGLSGVRFVKSGSVGEEIRLAEHYSLDERDRCERLTTLLRDLDKLDRREFQKAIHRARLYASPPINDDEARMVEAANSWLDRARDAYRRGQPEETRAAIIDALGYATAVRYSLDEVLERVIFSPSSYDSFGTVVAQQPVTGEVAGEAAVSVDFTLDSRDRKILYHGRQVYVMRNNRLFVMAFLGLPENLPLFEQVVATVSFPQGRCEH